MHSAAGEIFFFFYKYHEIYVLYNAESTTIFILVLRLIVITKFSNSHKKSNKIKKDIIVNNHILQIEQPLTKKLN